MVGGVETHTYYLARSLARKGVEVHVIALGRKWKSIEEKDGFVIHGFGNYVNSIWNFPYRQKAGQICEIVRGYDIDILHAHCLPWVPLYCSIAKHKTKKPLVVTVHSDPKEFRSFMSRLYKLALLKADKIIAVTKYMANVISSFTGIPLHRFTVIPGGIDPADYDLNIDFAKIKMISK